jgi:hypothetical protein
LPIADCRFLFQLPRRSEKPEVFQIGNRQLAIGNAFIRNEVPPVDRLSLRGAPV